MKIISAKFFCVFNIESVRILFFLIFWEKMQRLLVVSTYS